MSVTNYGVGDIVRIDDTGYPGLYEITTLIDIEDYPDFFEYDFFVTNDDCETELPVKHTDLTLVCRAEGRADI